MIPYQNDPKTAAEAIEKVYKAIDNKDFLGAFGRDDQARIVAAANDAQRSLDRSLANLAKEQQQVLLEKSNDLFSRALADRGNMQAYRTEFFALHGEQADEQWKKLEDTISFLDGAAFLNDDEYGRMRSNMSLAIHKEAMDTKAFKTFDEKMTYLLENKGSMTQDDYDKLLKYTPKFPEATQDPTFKAAISNTTAMQDMLNEIVDSSEMDNFLSQGSGLEATSVVGRYFKASLNAYIQDNPAAWQKALDNGTRKQFMNEAVNSAMDSILDHDFTGKGKTMRDEVTTWLQDPVNAAKYASNPLMQQYLGDTGIHQEAMKVVDEFAASFEANYQGSRTKIEGLTQDDAAEASDVLSRAVADDDGDGISNAREGLLSPEEELEVLENNLDADNPALIMQQNAQAVEEATGGAERRRASFTRADLGIDNLSSPTQSNGSRVNASVRSFNLGAIGEMYQGDVEKKFEKAFGRGYDSITLEASDGNPIKTPKFDTPEEGVQYFGFWLKHRGEPRSIEAIINKYQTGSPEAYKKHVEKLTGIPRGDKLDDDQLAEVAIAMFDWEAGTGSHTADLANQITSNMDVKANILKGMKLYEDN
jgi:hypothetical protein